EKFEAQKKAGESTYPMGAEQSSRCRLMTWQSTILAILALLTIGIRALPMKRSLTLGFLFLLATLAVAWPCRTLAAAQSPPPAGDLNSVLAQMNSSAASFKSAQADFEFESYQKVVDEKDLQKGRIYFRRSGKGDVEVAFNVTSPAPKQAL